MTYARVCDVHETLAGEEVLRLDDGVVEDERGGAADFWKQEGALRAWDGWLGRHAWRLSRQREGQKLGSFIKPGKATMGICIVGVAG